MASTDRPTQVFDWALFARHLDELLDLPPTDRHRRLLDLGRQHPELSERLGTALQDEAEAGISATLSEQGVNLPTADPDEPPTVAPFVGERLGSYALVEEIGAGGMSTVWRARRADGRYEHTVAVKFLRLPAAMAPAAGAASSPEGLEKMLWQRFAQEGRMLAQLDHPHIARLIDAGLRSIDGTPYWMMEWVDGQPIDRHVQAQRLGLRGVLKLFIDVLNAVDHAHQRLILHRDLKPSNVFVTDQGQVRLLDFGVAKVLTDSLVGPEPALAPTASPWADGDITQHGPTPFTPRYAAPEQLRGEDSSSATDVYAAGLLLYELLVGEPALRAQAPGESPTAYLARLAAPELQPPSRRASPARRREIDAELDAIVMQAAHPTRDRRYARVSDFRDDLRRWLRHEPVSAWPAHRVYIARKFLRRHWLPVGVTAAAFAGISVSLALALHQSSVAQEQRRGADDLVAFMLGDLKRRLEAVGRLDVLDSVAERALAHYAQSSPQSEGGRHSESQVQALRLLGETAMERGDLKAARHSLEAATALLSGLDRDRQALPNWLASRALVASAWAYLLELEGRPNEVWARYVEAETMLRQAVERTPPQDPQRGEWEVELAGVLTSHGITISEYGHPQDALPVFQEAKPLLLARLAERPAVARELANLMACITDAHYLLGQYREAVQEMSSVPPLGAEAEGRPPNRAAQRMWLLGLNRQAASHLALGQVDQALKVSQQVVSGSQALSALEPENRQLQLSLLHQRMLLAEVSQWAGDFRLARLQLAQAEREWLLLKPHAGGLSKLYVEALPTWLALVDWQVNGQPRTSIGPRDLMASHPHPGADLSSHHRMLMVRWVLAWHDHPKRPCATAGAHCEGLLQWADGLLSDERVTDMKADSRLHLRIALAQRLGQTQEASTWLDQLEKGQYRHPDLPGLAKALGRRPL